MTPPISPGPARGRDAVDLGQREPGRLERASGEPVDHFDMRAGGDLGHHAPVSGMLGDLAEHLVREDAPAPVLRKLHHGRGGFVAGRLKAEHAHRVQFR
jgi:hypothetical protein